MFLSEAWELYEQDKRMHGYSLHTLKGYRIQTNLLVRALGDINIETITFPQLKSYLISQNHLKPSSLGHRIKFIKSLFRWALDEGYIINRNPASKLKEPKMGKRIPKYLTEEEIELLREACQTPLHHALLEFFYSTGCRIQEVYKLNTTDIDWSRRSVIVNGKGDKEREVYFSIKCKIWLEKYLKTRKQNENNIELFITERKPYRRMSIARIREVIKEIAKNSEVETSVYPHKYRHSMATIMLNNGAPMEVIQQNLGHQKISTTQIYASLSGERRREMYNKYFR